MSHELFIRGDVGVNGVSVVPVVREGGVNVAKRQAGMIRKDLVRHQSHSLVPDGDMLYLDAVSGNARLPSADPRCDRDVFLNMRNDSCFSGIRHEMMITYNGARDQELAELWSGARNMPSTELQSRE